METSDTFADTDDAEVLQFGHGGDAVETCRRNGWSASAIWLQFGHGGDAVETRDFNWLQSKNRNLDEQLHHDAATEALVSLMRKPASFKPEFGKSLRSFLMMSADRDLKNLFRKEQKHQAGRNSIHDVELGDRDGNEVGRELELDEEVQSIRTTVLSEIQDGLTPEELDGLALMIDGERSTAAFIAVLKLDALPPEQHEGAVKKFKDKIKARIKRASKGAP